MTTVRSISAPAPPGRISPARRGSRTPTTSCGESTCASPTKPQGGPTNVNVMRHISDRRVTGPLTNELADDPRGLGRPDGAVQQRREGSSVFNPLEFTGLHVQSTTLTNRLKNASGYMIMPSYRGLPRHREPFLRKDFWVTRYKDPAATRSFPGRRRAVPRKHRGLCRSARTKADDRQRPRRAASPTSTTSRSRTPRRPSG